MEMIEHWVKEQLEKQAAESAKEAAEAAPHRAFDPEHLREMELFPTRAWHWVCHPPTYGLGHDLWREGRVVDAAPWLWRRALYLKASILLDYSHQQRGGMSNIWIGSGCDDGLALFFWGGMLSDFDLIRDYRLKGAEPKAMTYSELHQLHDDRPRSMELFLYALRWMEQGNDADLNWLCSRFNLSEYDALFAAWRKGDGLDEEVARLALNWDRGVTNNYTLKNLGYNRNPIMPVVLNSINAVMARAGLPEYVLDLPVLRCTPFAKLPPPTEPAPDPHYDRLLAELVPPGTEHRLRDELGRLPFPKKTRWEERREVAAREQAEYERQDRYDRNLLPGNRAEWFKKKWSSTKFNGDRYLAREDWEVLDVLSRIETHADLLQWSHPYYALSSVYSRFRRRAIVDSGIGESPWMGAMYISIEVYILQVFWICRRREMLDDASWNRSFDETDMASVGLWCLILGHLPGARYLSEHLRRIKALRSAEDDDCSSQLGVFARLFLALTDFEDGRGEAARYRLSRTGVPAYAALGEDWERYNGTRRALLGILDYRKTIHRSDHPYSDYTSATFAEDALAVLATRRRLGLPSPKLRHRLTIGNPLFVLPDGPIPQVEPEPEVAKIMKLLRYPECLAEELLCLKALPASAHGDPPPPKLTDKYPTEAELAQFLFGPPQKSEFALNRVTIELVSTLDAEGTLREILSELPADAWKIDSEVGRRVVTATAFGRTAQLDGTGRTPREVAAWAAELLRPEFDIRLVAETAGEADILVIVRPASFWALVDSQDPKTVARVLSAIEPGVAVPAAKPRARKGSK